MGFKFSIKNLKGYFSHKNIKYLPVLDFHLLIILPFHLHNHNFSTIIHPIFIYLYS